MNDIDEEDSYLPIPRNEMMNRVARTVDRERAAKLMTSESAPQLASVGGNKGGNDGRRGGKIRVRAKIHLESKDTLIISELPFSFSKSLFLMSLKSWGRFLNPFSSIRGLMFSIHCLIIFL